MLQQLAADRTEAYLRAIRRTIEQIVELRDITLLRLLWLHLSSAIAAEAECESATRTASVSRGHSQNFFVRAS